MNQLFTDILASFAKTGATLNPAWNLNERCALFLETEGYRSQFAEHNNYILTITNFIHVKITWQTYTLLNLAKFSSPTSNQLRWLSLYTDLTKADRPK
jgi:hypothetical protein